MQSAEMEPGEDHETTKRRLKKALSVAEKLKKDAQLEHEVNIELARRNDILKKEVESVEHRLAAAKSAMSGLEHSIKQLGGVVDTIIKTPPSNLTEVDTSNFIELYSSRSNCLDAFNSMKGALFTRSELMAEIDRIEKQTKAAAAAKEAEQAAKEAAESAAATAAATAASETAHSPSSTDQEDHESSRSRTGSVVGRSRTISMSAMKPRRNSSIFVRLPENSGTSLIRKSADVLPHSQALNHAVSVDGREGSGSFDDTHVHSDKHEDLVNASSMEENLDISMDLNVSRYPVNVNDSVMSEPVDTATVALFEHFIVVGASEQVAIEFAHQLQCSYDEGTLSNMFKNTFGGFFNSARFGAAGANQPGAAPSAGPPVSSAAATAQAGMLSKQKSASAAITNAFKPADEKNAGELTANRRRSFGLGGTNTAQAPTAQAGGDAATPVRNAGVFSYFMRSPTATNAEADARTKSADATKKIPADHRDVKTNQIDNLLEFDAFVETVHVEEGDVTPGKPRPQRRFIYGDDNSEHGSNSSQSSSDLVAAAGGRRSPTPGNSIKPVSPKNAKSSPDRSALTTGVENSGDISPIRTADGDGDTGTLLDFDDAVPDFPLPMSPPPPVPVVPAGTPTTTTPSAAAGTFSSRLGGAMSSVYSMSQKSAPATEPDSSAGASANASQRVDSKGSADSQDNSLGGYFFGSSPPKPRRDPPETLPPKIPAVISASPVAAAVSPTAKPAGKVTGAPAASASGIPGSNLPAEDAFVRSRVRSNEIISPGTTAPAPAAVPARPSTGSSGNLPAVVYTSNPRAAELITQSDKKIGTATTKAEILYRYPPTVEPPPQEVSDFCMPLGGKISKLSDFDSGTTVQEILFGHSHSKRSSRCFIFLLEDKTLADEVGDEETGVGNNRLYGICVLHPRLIKTPIQNTRRKNPLAQPQPHASAMDASAHGSYNGTAGLVAESEYIEFESMVCYAFLTRFPLFDFFFQVIFDLINTERLTRMELAAEHSDSDLLYSRSVYQYLPSSVLEEVLARLTKLPPPMHGEKFQFHISPGIKPIESIRVPPPADFSEHYMNSSEWALPTLLSWMPVESIIWAMSLLLGEAKIVVIGHDYGMVSCAVIGLLVLLRPLDWVSPVIPMLPTKLMDFVESPVPILVGITVSSKDQVITVEHIFDRCSDPSNDGIVLSVLDVSKRELYISTEDKDQLDHLCMPGADALSTKIKNCLADRTPSGAVQISSVSSTAARAKPVYTASLVQRAKTRAAHDVMTKHIASIAAQAVAHHQKLIDRRRLIVEMADKLSPHRVTRDPALGSIWEQGQSFGADDQEGDEPSDEDVPISPSGANTRNGMNTSTHSTSSNGPQPSGISAAFGKVLRPRTSTETDAEIERGGNDRQSLGGAGNKRMSIMMPASAAVQKINSTLAPVPPTPPSRLIQMSKQSFKGRNKEEFLNRFILTQIFAEHVHRQRGVETSASLIPTVDSAATGLPPLATVLEVAAPLESDMTPLSSAYSPVLQSGNGSPDFGEGSRKGLSVETTLDTLGLVDATPRSSVMMRRRSVDMSYLMSTGKLGDHAHDTAEDAAEATEAALHDISADGVTRLVSVQEDEEMP